MWGYVELKGSGFSAFLGGLQGKCGARMRHEMGIISRNSHVACGMQDSRLGKQMGLQGFQTSGE